MEKGKEISKGKAKSLFKSTDANELIMEFRDDTSAFDGEKIVKLSEKGLVNNKINAFIMQELEKKGIQTHFLKLMDNTHSLVRSLDMLPIECVVRNIATGSLVKRLGLEDGLVLERPLFEFFLKNDELHDPMINDDHIILFKWAKEEELKVLKDLSFQINHILKEMFLQADMLLVDFKLEFGRYSTNGGENVLFLGDEFTPDGCRIWDKNTMEKLDKDRFRKDLGDTVYFYKEVAKRLGVTL